MGAFPNWPFNDIKKLCGGALVARLSARSYNLRIQFSRSCAWNQAKDPARCYRRFYRFSDIMQKLLAFCPAGRTGIREAASGSGEELTSGGHDPGEFDGQRGGSQPGEGASGNGETHERAVPRESLDWRRYRRAVGPMPVRDRLIAPGPSGDRKICGVPARSTCRTATRSRSRTCSRTRAEPPLTRSWRLA